MSTKCLVLDSFVLVQKRSSPREAYYRGENWCSVGAWGFHPAPPVHSSYYGGWHPIPWLTDHGYRPWVGWMTHLSIQFPLACGAHEHDHNCEATRSQIHYWKHVCLQCLRSQRLCVLPHTRRGHLWSKVNLGHMAKRLDRSTAARSLFTILRTDNLLRNRRIISTCRPGAETKRLSLTVQLSLSSGCGQTPPTSTPPLIWPTSVFVALQIFAEASLGPTQHSCHFSLRITLNGQSYNSHQYLLLQITRHDALKEWWKIENDLARNTRSIEPSIG